MLRDNLDEAVNKVAGGAPIEHESDLDQLVDEVLGDKRLGERSKEADRKRRNLSGEQFYKLRARCKRDLFFLAYGVLNYTRLSTRLHGQLCTIIKATEEEWRFREWLLPRGHFKSTVITISYNIQRILPYGNHERQHDPLAHIPLFHPQQLGVNNRILIGHETETGAQRFLIAITNHLVSNPTLLALFPEIKPEKRVHRINKSELELPRTQIYPEPTFDTMGVGAKSQGKHYNTLCLDDIYGDKARDSIAEDTTTKEWLDAVQSFFDQLNIDTIDFVGTRYKFDDAYGHIEDTYEGQLYIYRRSVEEKNPETGKLEPIFEEVTPQSLAILRKNPKNFAANYMNDPSMDGVGFNKEWKRYFEWKDKTHIYAYITRGDQRIRIDRYIRELNTTILIDPGERTGGFTVTGTDHELRTFVLQAISIDFNPSVLVELLFRSVIRWMPRLVAIESDSMQNVFQYWFRSEMQKRGIYFTVIPVHTNQRSKERRIMGLSPYLSGEQLFISKTQTDLDKEIDRFGKVTSKSIHILDALAYGPEVWSRGMNPGSYVEIYGDNRNAKLDWRDKETGYSPIHLEVA